MPDVRSLSPGRMSAVGAMKRSSGGRPAPAPNNTLRTPLRSTRTGTAWSLSVTSVTSAIAGNTRVTWPTTPNLVDHRFAGLDAGVGAAVDEHLLRERIASGVEDLDGDRRSPP